MSIRTRNDNYWKKRSMQRLIDAEKNSLPYLRRIKTLYRNSAKDTVETVRSLYRNYYKDKDGFDIKVLEKLANKGDLKRFQADLKRAGLSEYLPEHYRGRLSRAELLNAKIWAETKKIAFKEQQLSTESYNKTFKDTYNKAIYDVSKGVNKNIAFTEIPQKTIDGILNAKFYGENYSQRVWHNTGKLANKVQEIIGESILTGKSQYKAIREIQQAYGTRGKAKGGYYDAERLLRTETNYFENKAEIEAYDEMGIKKFKYLAVLDSRTSEICRDMDGKIFDVKDAVQGENTPPLHPNCRSTIVPYISKEYEPETRIARDPETGKNYYIENMNYREWEKEYVNNKPNVLFEKNATLNRREEKVVKWANNYFGGKITVLAESNKRGVKTPDIRINNIKFEIKSTSGTLKTLDTQIRYASHQSKNIIVDITGAKYNAIEAYKVIRRRMERNDIEQVYVIRNGKLLKRL